MKARRTCHWAIISQGVTTGNSNVYHGDGVAVICSKGCWASSQTVHRMWEALILIFASVSFLLMGSTTTLTLIAEDSSHVSEYVGKWIWTTIDIFAKSTVKARQRPSFPLFLALLLLRLSLVCHIWSITTAFSFFLPGLSRCVRSKIHIKVHGGQTDRSSARRISRRLLTWTLTEQFLKEGTVTRIRIRHAVSMCECSDITTSPTIWSLISASWSLATLATSSVLQGVPGTSSTTWVCVSLSWLLRLHLWLLRWSIRHNYRCFFRFHYLLSGMSQTWISSQTNVDRWFIFVISAGLGPSSAYMMRHMSVFERWKVGG